MAFEIDTTALFRDRGAAGAALADPIAVLDLEDPIVLALPRGGVPVAAEIARRLGAPLDVLAVRKIGAPDQPELGIGAVAEGDVRVLDTDLIAALGLAPDDVERATAIARDELGLATRRFHPRPAPDLAGRTALIVDDGIATGGTVLAAIRAARERGAHSVVVATPVAPPTTVDRLAHDADQVIVLRTPEEFRAVGIWYRDFRPVADAEVERLLDDASHQPHDGSLPLRAGAVTIPVDEHIRLDGDLHVPADACGLVLFAHGSGSSRRSPRNVEVAHALVERGVGTLLFDLLEADEADDRRRVFDIPLLALRLQAALRWVREDPVLATLPIGLFGASTGAAAALVAAAVADTRITTVVSRGGRPDLAGDALPRVTCPVLLLVGGADPEVLELNRQAQRDLGGPSELRVIEAATHLFPEPGALEEVAAAAGEWFADQLASAVR